MTCHIPTLGLVVVLASAVPGLALAQDAPTRPYKGLFGGNERKQETKQTLVITTDVQGGYDNDVLGISSSQPIDPRYQIGGEYGSSTIALMYSAATAGRALTVSGRGAGDFRYSPTALNGILPSQEGSLSVGLAKTVGALSFNAGQGAAYTPYRRLTLFPRLPQLDPAAVVPAGADYAVSTDQVLALNSNAGVGLQLGRRSYFNLAYGRSQADYSGQGKVVDQSATGTVRYGLTKYAALRVGYTYRLSSYARTPGSAPIPSQNIDGGIEYRRPLSLSRKTSLGFSTGSTGTSDGYRTMYFATGSASLNHEIGRSWGTSLSYGRELSFLDGYSTPFLSDGVSAQVSGYLGRRVDLSLNAGYSGGASALQANGSRFRTSTGAGRVRLAFSRFGSLYVQYIYYQYSLRNFDRAVQGIPPSMERRSVRGGITLWLPLLR